MSHALELVEAHLAAEDAHDVAATLATFTDDCYYRIPAQGIALRGKEAIRGHYAALFATFPDFRNVVEAYYEADGHVFVELHAERTHSRPWAGFAPTGRLLRTWALAHFPIASDGLLAGEIVHLNPAEALYQIGALPSTNLMEVAAELARLRALVRGAER